MILANSQEDGDAELEESKLEGGVIVKPYDRDDLIELVRNLAGGN